MSDPINLMKDIILRYRNAGKWVAAPLSRVKTLSNSHVGDVGQDFVREWCVELGLECEGAPNKQHPWDARIEGITFEIKTATEDVNGNFQFNHIRLHRDYQAVLCLGIAPDAVLFHSWRKGYVAENKAGRLVTMDKGSSATWKLTKKRQDLLPIGNFQSRLNAVVSEVRSQP